MKGLILKDLFSIKKSLTISAALVVFYIVWSVLTDINFAGIVAAVSVVMGISTFSYDEYNHWDKIAMSMPLSPKDIIAGKFLVVMILGGLAGVMGIVISFVSSLFLSDVNILEDITGIMAVAVVSCVICFITIPFIIKFGVERAKIVFMIFFAGIACLGFLLGNEDSAPDMSAVSDGMIIAVILAASLVISLIAYFISVKFYSDKEF